MGAMRIGPTKRSGDTVVLVCAGVVLSSPDRLSPEVPLQQCRASKVSFTLGGRSEEDTGQPAGRSSVGETVLSKVITVTFGDENLQL